MLPGDSPVMAGFSVPKKKFRSSVHRHRIRRLIVEAWRLNKNIIYPLVHEKTQIHVFFIFTDSKMPDYSTVLTLMSKCIDKMSTIVPSLIIAENAGN